MSCATTARARAARTPRCRARAAPVPRACRVRAACMLRPRACYGRVCVCGARPRCGPSTRHPTSHPISHRTASPRTPYLPLTSCSTLPPPEVRLHPTSLLGAARVPLRTAAPRRVPRPGTASAPPLLLHLFIARGAPPHGAPHRRRRTLPDPTRTLALTRTLSPHPIPHPHPNPNPHPHPNPNPNPNILVS